MLNHRSHHCVSSYTRTYGRCSRSKAHARWWTVLAALSPWLEPWVEPFPVGSVLLECLVKSEWRCCVCAGQSRQLVGLQPSPQ